MKRLGKPIEGVQEEIRRYMLPNRIGIVLGMKSEYNTVEDGNHCYLLAGVFHQNRQGGILTGGRRRCDGRIRSEPSSDERNQNKRKYLPEYIAEKGHGADLGAG